MEEELYKPANTRYKAPSEEMDKKHMKSPNMSHEGLWSVPSKRACSAEKLSRLLKAQQRH